MLFRRRRSPARTPGLTAYRALGRYVLLPSADWSGAGRLQDADRLAWLPTDIDDVELGQAVLDALQPPRRLDLRSVDEQAAHHRHVRRLVLRAFGVTTDREWLAAATSASVTSAGETVKISPWRRSGSRNSWVGRQGDPVAEPSASDVPGVGESLREMLALTLPRG